MFFLRVLLFVLYEVAANCRRLAFWLGCLTAMLGLSMQDNAAGQNVYRAFAIRMALFLAPARWRCGSMAAGAGKADSMPSRAEAAFQSQASCSAGMFTNVIER